MTPTAGRPDMIVTTNVGSPVGSSGDATPSPQTTAAPGVTPARAHPPAGPSRALTGTPPMRATHLLGLVAAALTLAACDGSTDPVLPPVAKVAISGVSVDPATFRSEGKFGLGIVATTAAGEVILDNRVEITPAITSTDDPAPGATYSARLVAHQSQPAGTKPLAAALSIDNSGSMSTSDPQLLRTAAAKVFWDAVLETRESNVVALTDFGQGSTAGFGSTRLLAGWGRDTTLLEERVATMRASGGTPLYESVTELLQWIDTTRTSASAERVLLVMTDGQPNSDFLRDDTADLANALGIRIHTVGLGDASDLGPRPNSAAVVRVRELAFETGGVYSAATNATALAEIFQTMARVTSAGQFLAELQVSPIPPSGTTVTGTVTVSSGGATETATWSLVVP